MKRLGKTLPLVAVLAAISVQAVSADSYFDNGRSFFDKRQWAKALPYFHKAAEDSPWDSTAAYYEALCYHQLRDWGNAKKAYKGIVEHFPGSPAYSNAIAALKVLDPSFVNQHNNGTPAATLQSTSNDSGADAAALMAKVVVTAPGGETQIPVQRVTNKTWVDGSVNGRSFKFDFGGENTTISPKDAKAMGMAVSSGKAIGTVKVGQISESNFPVSVEETASPKLGNDFFNQFSYTLNPSSISATKKAGGASGSSWDVPFSKSGKDMMINVLCNGRRVSVVFDPDGGENVVPKNRAREFGLEVNEGSTLNRYDADTNPNGPLRGQPGWGEMKDVTAADGKVVVGPCSSQVHFKIDDKATSARVTPSVFGGWRYQVDPAAQKLHFTH